MNALKASAALLNKRASLLCLLLFYHSYLSAVTVRAKFDLTGFKSISFNMVMTVDLHALGDRPQIVMENKHIVIHNEKGPVHEDFLFPDFKKRHLLSYSLYNIIIDGEKVSLEKGQFKNCWVGGIHNRDMMLDFTIANISNELTINREPAKQIEEITLPKLNVLAPIDKELRPPKSTVENEPSETTLPVVVERKKIRRKADSFPTIERRRQKPRKSTVRRKRTTHPGAYKHSPKHTSKPPMTKHRHWR